MPKTQREVNKKHGDQLRSLVDRAASGSEQGQRDAEDDERDEAGDDTMERDEGDEDAMDRDEGDDRPDADR